MWSGFLFGIGVLLLLSTLGLAIGISTADIGARQGMDARAIGVGAGIWSALSLLIALFYRWYDLQPRWNGFRSRDRDGSRRAC